MLQPRILSVTPMPNYCLKLHYETGETKIFDVKPYIIGSWYGQLADKGYFSTVKVSANGTGVEWQDEQDIAPQDLYNLSKSV